MERTYCVSCKKYTGNSHFDSKTINYKVKLLKTKFCKSQDDKYIFKTTSQVKTNANLLFRVLKTH